MEWCLDCHRNPAQYVRPREAVFDMQWQPPTDQLEQGGRLVRDYKILPTKVLTSCSTCHR